MAEKMAVVCNGDTPANIMPTLIFASSGIAVDYEVHVFICPAGARWMLKGELEKLGTPKGLPNPVKLFNDILDQGGEIVLCELALDLAQQVLKPGGGLLVKLFQGEGFEAYNKALKTGFSKVVMRKPKASRARSREVYALATGFLGKVL